MTGSVLAPDCIHPQKLCINFPRSKTFPQNNPKERHEEFDHVVKEEITEEIDRELDRVTKYDYVVYNEAKKIMCKILEPTLCLLQAWLWLSEHTQLNACVNVGIGEDLFQIYRNLIACSGLGALVPNTVGKLLAVVSLDI